MAVGKRAARALAAAAAAAVLIAAAVVLASTVKGAEPAVLEEQRALYSARPAPPEPKILDVVYRGGIFDSRALDIYLPTDGSADAGSTADPLHPAVVFVHGGSWMHGAKEDIRVIDRFLAKMRERGWTVVSIDYVASPLGLLDAPAENVRAAFEWLRENGPEYGIDPENMGLYSVSAGSHLAMESLVLSDDPAAEWRFWLDEYGPVDLVAMANGEAFESSGRLARFPNRYLRKHSPVLHVERAFPPTAIVHGDADRIVALAQSERLAETLAVHGTDVSLKVVPGGDHGFFNKSQEDWMSLEDEFLGFMGSRFDAGGN